MSSNNRPSSPSSSSTGAAARPRFVVDSPIRSSSAGGGFEVDPGAGLSPLPFRLGQSEETTESLDLDSVRSAGGEYSFVDDVLVLLRWMPGGFQPSADAISRGRALLSGDASGTGYAGIMVSMVDGHGERGPALSEGGRCMGPVERQGRCCVAERPQCRVRQVEVVVTRGRWGNGPRRVRGLPLGPWRGAVCVGREAAEGRGGSEVGRGMLGGSVPSTLSILSHLTAVAPWLTLGEVYEGLLGHDLLAHWCKVSGLLGEDVVKLIKYELLGVAGDA